MGDGVGAACWRRRVRAVPRGGSTIRSTAARRCSASAGPCVVGHGRSSAQGRAQRHPDGRTGSRPTGFIPRVEQELAAARTSHRDCIHLSGTGLADGRHGQGARRRVPDVPRDVRRGRRRARRAAEPPVLRGARGAAACSRENTQPAILAVSVAACRAAGVARRRADVRRRPQPRRVLGARGGGHDRASPTRCASCGGAAATCRRPCRWGRARWPPSSASTPRRWRRPARRRRRARSSAPRT